MRTRTFALGLVVLMAVVGSSWAKKKEKQTLPDIVLRAQTVFVIIQPGANEPATDVTANQKTVKGVEEALMRWGRFRLAQNSEVADIVITVMKGTQGASPMVSGGPVDSRPVILDTTENSIRIGGQQGRPPDATQTADTNAGDGRAHTGMQVGSVDDIFRVYLAGGIKYPLDAAAVWNYSGKDVLKAPSVPAVEQFRKAIEESEKAAARKQQEKEKQQPTTKNSSSAPTV